MVLIADAASMAASAFLRADDDVLFEILSHLTVGTAKPVGSEGLLALALTNKRFTPFAMNVIWRSLPGHRPLLGLLYTSGISQLRHLEDAHSSDSGTRSLSGYTHYHYTVTHHQSYDALSAHPGWDRFLVYARYVQEVSFGALASSSSPSVWTELGALTKGHLTILPRLHRITLHCSEWDPAPCRAPFRYENGQLALISATVRHATINLDLSKGPLFDKQHTPSALRYVSDIISFRCPALEIVELKSNFWPLRFATLRHLRSLTLPHTAVLSFDDLRMISALPSLAELSFTASLRQRDSGSSPLSDVCFPVVTKLTIDGIKPIVGTILAEIQFPSLTSLHIGINGTKPPRLIPHVHNLVSAIAGLFPKLKSLHVRFYLQSSVLRDNDMHQYVLERPERTLSTLLAPFLPLKCLRSLSLTLLLHDISYSSPDILEAALAWPALEELRLTFRGRYSSLALGTATLDVLAHVARACPRLRVLHLPETTHAVGALRRARADLHDVTAHDALQELVLGTVVVREGSAQGAKEEIREFVDGVFPYAAHAFEMPTMQQYR
ncbi:uncharacterized protein BXZ73DRAFT_77651 [Epithele typhae]|uniref:uncharacterized protein n=1 Tax=Epithele typhae TaxID=378194 RepID=UPI002008BC6F|nr:uncharacterized protein BXZ73DRAFT_77651 [Epithele typhae]KAH9931628.1 hypothetical protein BXZ73DRAFT_77651 [Epithele typhae]